uniref:ornithine decarboxylase n=1 Tax=Soboliphyme baturini TaxID=241478 RepID=A0A183IU29_9BILA
LGENTRDRNIAQTDLNGDQDYDLCRCSEGHDEPFYTFDIGHVLRQHSLWLKYMPRFQPYYAVKCNSHKLLLTVLEMLGCNFDCASKNEIERVMSLGVPADRIIYANPCKTANYIRHAAACRVEKMTFDNEEELYKVKKLFPDATLVLRIAVSDPTAVCPLNLKFGSEPSQGAPALLRLAAALELKVAGISFHVGSGCRDPVAYAVAIEHAKNLFDYGRTLGHPMHILDIGGGFPGHDNPDVVAFETIAEIVNKNLDIHFASDSNLTLIAEPGRFYAESSFTLYCSVIASTRVSADRITKNESNSSEVGYMYYINDGVYGSFNCILYDHCQPSGKPSLDYCWTSIWGPTCDSLDLVVSKCKMAPLNEGDWLVFGNMGAYTFAAGSEFNGFPRPTMIVVCSEEDL